MFVKKVGGKISVHTAPETQKKFYSPKFTYTKV